MNFSAGLSAGLMRFMKLWPALGYSLTSWSMPSVCSALSSLAARPGRLRAEGHVVQRTRRVAFCAAELYDAEGTPLASARCTQVIRK